MPAAGLVRLSFTRLATTGAWPFSLATRSPSLPRHPVEALTIMHSKERVKMTQIVAEGDAHAFTDLKYSTLLCAELIFHSRPPTWVEAAVAQQRVHNLYMAIPASSNKSVLGRHHPLVV